MLKTMVHLLVDILRVRTTNLTLLKKIINCHCYT